LDVAIVIGKIDDVFLTPLQFLPLFWGVLKGQASPLEIDVVVFERRVVQALDVKTVIDLFEQLVDAKGGPDGGVDVVIRTA
jgi:hypothetical protein